MKNKHFDIIIIGAGCLGASLFRSLKLRGVEKILLIDKGNIGSGISAQSGGMVRVFHHHLNDRLAASYSLNTFYQLEKEIGLNISKVGSLSIISQNKAKEVSNEFDILSSNEMKIKFPNFNFSKNELGIHEKKGASISVSEYINKVIYSYKTNKDHLLEETFVYKVNSNIKEGHEVITSNGNYYAQKVIVSSGLGLKKILPDICQDENIEIREIITYEVKKKHPILMVNFFDYTNIFYGTNSFHGKNDSLRIGIQSGILNPKNKIKEYADKRFKFDFDLVDKKFSAKDIYTKERSGLSGEVCGREGLFVLTGWGGGAFKFSPFLAHHLVEKIMKKRPRIRRIYETTI